MVNEMVDMASIPRAWGYTIFKQTQIHYSAVKSFKSIFYDG
jgi:hypothetical protein